MHVFARRKIVCVDPDGGLSFFCRTALGLFSLIDAIMDDSMGALMQKLPLSDAIKKALISGEGILGDYLKLATGYERADWKNAALTASKLGMREEGLPKCFIEALSWANSFSDL